MMGNKQKLTGDAVDMVRFRGMYKYISRAGVKKKIKRRLHKALRKETLWDRIDETITAS